MLKLLLEASRPVKRLISVIYDCFAISLSLYLAWALRLGTPQIDVSWADFTCLVITLCVSILVFIRLGLYRAILRFMAHQAVLSVIIGVFVSSITLATSSYFIAEAYVPRSVPIIYVFTALFFVGIPRAVIRNVVQMMSPKGEIKVAVYGAGVTGSQLLSSLQHSPDFHPIAFIDDDRKLQGSSIRALTVHPPRDITYLIEHKGLSKVFLALGNVSRSDKQRIVRHLENSPIQVQTIPPFSDIISGKARIEELRDVQIEDLLGRDPVEPNVELMQADITGKNVMVTGAGGSIGSELCRQIVQHAPKTLVLFELNEHNLYRIHEELSNTISQRKLNIELAPMLGSARYQQRVEDIMRSFKVDTVYHAAAYKHVPLVELNMIEGVRNNVFGTLHCAQAAIKARVKTFVLISTDKAVRPTNIMGASKRLAELAITAVNSTQNTTKFCAVRFGNVLGSSGSVVPKLRKQIQTGGPITITHPEVTRYFMTITEAAQLVIQAGALAKGGETYVLDMGEPVKIADMAREMVLLSGLTLKNEANPNGDIEMEFIGLRPGEKLYEELLVEDNVVGTKHPRIMEAVETIEPVEVYHRLLEQLHDACTHYNYKEVHRIIVDAPVAYDKRKEIEDIIYNKRQTKEKPELTIILQS